MTRNTLRQRFFWVLKHTLNRLTTRLARSGHGPFSLVRQVGRKSGRTYETPLILAEVPQGFVAELTYGDKVDWYRNIVAAGGASSSTTGGSTTSTASSRAAPSRAAMPTP